MSSTPRQEPCIDPLDLDNMRVTDEDLAQLYGQYRQTIPSKPRRTRRSATRSLVVPQFPGKLQAQLTPLPGKCLSLYMVLITWCRIKVSNVVEITEERCHNAGITRKQKSVGLHLLEQAGLITVERQARKTPLVTVHAVDENGQWNAAIRATHHLR